jgi:ABC-type nitrate/sulfonate/bicarbonate transport system substrate-binding protein
MLCSCGGHTDKLRFGIIEPSIDHLPLSYALSKGLISSEKIELVHFSSGWEANEALVHNKIDLAILPLTYIWSDVSKGYSVKRLSSFERESDGVISQNDITDLSQLNGQKIGVLKASILDVLIRKLADRNGFQYKPVYFRTPSEMIAALKAKEVAAVVLYVPLLQTLETKYNILYYFEQNAPRHPCCNLAVNTNSLIHKQKQIQLLKNDLTNIINVVNNQSDDYLNYVCKRYQLTQNQAYKALSHVIFDMQTTPYDLIFEFDVAYEMKAMGYLEEIPNLPQVVLEEKHP